MILIYDCNDSGQYYKTTITIVIYDPSQFQPELVSSILIVSDAPNWSVIYDRKFMMVKLL